MTKPKIIKHFSTLQKQDKWLNSWKRKLLEKIGMFSWDVFSPILCCCNMDPSNTNLSYIESKYFGDVIPIFKCMMEHYGDEVKECGETLGTLVGIQATQEDFYWIIRDKDDHTRNRYISCCAGLEF